MDVQVLHYGRPEIIQMFIFVKVYVNDCLQ